MGGWCYAGLSPELARWALAPAGRSSILHLYTYCGAAYCGAAAYTYFSGATTGVVFLRKFCTRTMFYNSVFESRSLRHTSLEKIQQFEQPPAISREVVLSARLRKRIEPITCRSMSKESARVATRVVTSGKVQYLKDVMYRILG